MNYKKKPLSDILRSTQTVFTFKDIVLIWGDTDPKASIAAVNYYIRTGSLYRIRRGLYAKDHSYDVFEAATKLYTPSYISFETVLAQAGVIFQYYGAIIVASYLTREIRADGRVFSYRKIKDSILTHREGIVSAGNYHIASPERAYLDVMYLHSDYHFDHLAALDWDKVRAILSAYGGNERMKKQVAAHMASACNSSR